MSLVCFVRIAGAALVALVVCACETLPEGPFPRATEVGWWNDEGASGPLESLFMSVNRKRTFTRVNV
jgi:phage gp46-like protein